MVAFDEATYVDQWRSKDTWNGFELTLKEDGKTFNLPSGIVEFKMWEKMVLIKAAVAQGIGMSNMNAKLGNRVEKKKESWGPLTHCSH